MKRNFITTVFLFFSLFMQGCHGCADYSMFCPQNKHFLAVQIQGGAPITDVFMDDLRIGRTDSNGNFCKIYPSYDECVHQFWSSSKRYGFRYPFYLNHNAKIICTGCPNTHCLKYVVTHIEPLPRNDIRPACSYKNKG